ncbi:hypothetical protein PQ465_08835 [Sphingobacterium oryzagri]|uniref:Outer membrane protein beta-barrel domain-containing protein n=1 Tax=Sphingobacterium oryzagri TaxID=3025669 RepID=A0ABY7WPI6_9SPHI|nr:hypothetical protein [Sphingobacterium sp. KACC 22765]WDF70464.1 hypothetical protein PQ465_08835 [Sphingobacterium sp. KACC 22765]
MKKLVFFLSLHLLSLHVFAQIERDTIHYHKIYYMGGTGLSLPIGKASEVFTTKLFSASMGLDIALKDSRYFLTPTLYLLTYGYNQQVPDPKYNYMIENGRANFYMLSMAAGRRRQFKRLNTFVYLGPALGLVNEPRGDLVGQKLRMDSKYSLSVAGKLGTGVDYKFPGFFIGAELGYLQHFRKIEGNPVQFLTIMVGLKSDITSLSSKVTHAIGIDPYDNR